MMQLACFLVIIFFCPANPTEGCTIVMVAKGKILLAGNNEDWKIPRTHVAYVFDRERTIPASEELFRVVETQRVEKAIERFHGMKSVFRTIYRYDVSEQEINALGHMLLRGDQADEAIEIFKLNVSEHPKAWNVYDSLGEAYMKQGKKGLAIENYGKSFG